MPAPDPPSQVAEVFAQAAGVHEPEPTDAGVRANARLTAVTGAVLLVVLAAEGVTIPFTGPLLRPHVFIGMLLVPLALLKIASTGWKIVRYYTGHRPYVQAGPPPMWRRVLGPLVVASTITVLGTGIAIIVVRPRSQLLITAHQVSFFPWFAFVAVHVLAHVVRTYRATRNDVRAAGPPTAGRRGRSALILGSVLAGIPLALGSLTWLTHWLVATGRG